MRIMVIGSGAREHALAWKLHFCRDVSAIYVVPGNAGTALLARRAQLDLHDITGLRSFALQNAIDLTVVGPEGPLAEGIVDAFVASGLRIFGPSRAAAQLETSKAWAKGFMQRHGIPTARYVVADAVDEATAAIRELGAPIVLKADGLAGGKGVMVCQTMEDAEAAVRQLMIAGAVGDAGRRVVIEEILEGVELSVFAMADGQSVLPLTAARDFKRLHDGDAGPNTGGMGGYAPPAYATPELLELVRRTILEPTVAGMAAEGNPYTGILYAGLMLTREGPKVLEFNCRWGDPEAEIVLPLLKSDMLELMNACVDGTLAGQTAEWEPAVTCGVVLAARGYPVAPQIGAKISGLDDLDEGVLVFHGATRMLETPSPQRGWLRRMPRRMTEHDVGTLVDGGRALIVVAKGATLEQARATAYANVERIHFDGMQFRHDIGAHDPTLTEVMGTDWPRAPGAAAAARPTAAARAAAPAATVVAEPPAATAQPAAPGRLNAPTSAPLPATNTTTTDVSSQESGATVAEGQTSVQVVVVMGSESDRPIMEEAAKILTTMGIPHDVRVMSAHRTPERVREFARTAESREIRVIIAGAGGAAHLPGVIAAQTTVPVIGVPIQGSSMMGLDSLLSIVQMPGGVPVATVAVGNAGARNAAYLAAAIIGLVDENVRARYRQFRVEQSGGELA